MTYFIVLSCFFLMSCNNLQNENKKGSGINLNDSARRLEIVKQKNTIENTSEIVGNWFTPHSAEVKLNFSKSGRFEFNDYNLKLDRYELLSGNYDLHDSTLTLKYDDRAAQKFIFYKGDDDNYYIKKKGYYFVKEDSL